MPNTSEFDLDFRPASYWDLPDPVSALLTNVKGELRRELVRDVLTAEGAQRGRYQALGLGELDPDLYAQNAREHFVESLFPVVGPRALSGEYLPDHRPAEVEIARIVLASVTGDVYSVRARRSGGRMRYRIADEYAGDWALTQQSSVRPLTLRQLIRLIDTAVPDGEAWGARGDLTEVFRDGAVETGEPEEAAAFVRVSSTIYPDLARWYAGRAADWLSTWYADREESATEDDSHAAP